MESDFEKKLQKINDDVRNDFDGRFDMDYYRQIESLFESGKYGPILSIEERKHSLHTLLLKIIKTEAKLYQID